MRKIGVTGGICSGKSTLVKAFVEHNIRVIDADILGHQTYQPGTQCHRMLRDAFGDGIVGSNGEIDRKVLGGMVFGNAEKMQTLRDIVWPEIRKLIAISLAECEKNGEKCVVVEAAVLLEAGWQDLFDEIWVVSVSPEVAIRRLVARNGMTVDEARKRLASQMTNEDRNAYATVTIDNSGSEEHLRATVTALLSERLC